MNLEAGISFNLVPNVVTIRTDLIITCREFLLLIYGYQTMVLKTGFRYTETSENHHK